MSIPFSVWQYCPQTPSIWVSFHPWRRPKLRPNPQQAVTLLLAHILNLLKATSLPSCSLKTQQSQQSPETEPMPMTVNDSTHSPNSQPNTHAPFTPRPYLGKDLLPSLTTPLPSPCFPGPFPINSLSPRSFHALSFPFCVARWIPKAACWSGTTSSSSSGFSGWWCGGT